MKRPLTVAALMDINVPRVAPEQPILEVLRSFRRAHSKYALVVRDGRFEGLITERDIRLALPSRFADPSVQQFALSQLTAGDVCIAAPHSVTIYTELSRALELMLDKNISALPVLQDHTALGILTLRDVARCWLALSRGDSHRRRRPWLSSAQFAPTRGGA